MPETSASFPPSSPERRSRRGRRSGFTLLELLVVLVIVALVAGVVAPLAARGLAAARERAMLADLQALLEGLPVRAFASGAAQDYDAARLGQLLGGLPEGWSLQLGTPLRYGASGVASGGLVSLAGPERTVTRLRVLPVSGEVLSGSPAR